MHCTLSLTVGWCTPCQQSKLHQHNRFFFAECVIVIVIVIYATVTVLELEMSAAANARTELRELRHL